VENWEVMCAQPVHLGSRMLVESLRRRCAYSPERPPCSGRRQNVCCCQASNSRSCDRCSTNSSVGTCGKKWKVTGFC